MQLILTNCPKSKLLWTIKTICSVRNSLTPSLYLQNRYIDTVINLNERNMSDSPVIIYIPTEILLKIYKYLSAKQLMICRGVCTRWKQIIDDITGNQLFWHNQCKRDFYSVHVAAKQKCLAGMDWADVYRSLTLWPKLSDAKEDQDEFCAATIVQDEIKDFKILRNGVIGVHKRSAIVYYDALTLKPIRTSAITGDYLRYAENDLVVIVLSYNLQMFILKKSYSTPRFQVEVMYNDIKTFLLLDDAVYFINITDDIYVCKLMDRRMARRFIVHSNDSIVAMGHCNNHLQVLTLERNIFTVIENKMVFATTLGPTCNLLHILHQYNFLELLDWRVYFQWMFVLNHTIPQGPLQDIVTTRTYGDVIFIGSNWGVLRIYYQPYKLGEFDLFSSEPVKQYNFMVPSDCPVLSMCPILSIDVLEVGNGHTVIVAMPKKIAVLNYRHSFSIKTRFSSKRPTLPIFTEEDEESVKIIDTDGENVLVN